MPVGTETDVEEMRSVKTSEGETDSPANETLQKEIRETVAQEVSNAREAIVAAQPTPTKPIEERGTKVDVNLYQEGVTVPDNTVWVVSILVSNMSTGDKVRFSTDEAGFPVDMTGDRHMEKVTIHSGVEISSDDRTRIMGWEVPV